MVTLGLTSRYYFGKKHYGKFAIDVVMDDPQYVKWAMKKYGNYDLSPRLQRILDQFLIDNPDYDQEDNWYYDYRFASLGDFC